MKVTQQLTGFLRDVKFILLIITAFIIVGCAKNSNNKILYATDSLLREKPEKALQLLDSMADYKLSYDDKMHYSWNRAKSLQTLKKSLADESLLPDLVEYYRKKGDTSKLLDGYLLTAFYSNSIGKKDKAFAALDSGYRKAESIKDTTMMIQFLYTATEFYNQEKDYKNTTVKLREILKFSEKLNLRERSYVMYLLGLNLSLSGDKSYDEWYQKSIDTAIAARDTMAACEYMRNYAGSLSGDHKYRESNNFLYAIKKLNPQIGSLSAIQMELAENYINLRKLDSAHICFNAAVESEKTLQAEGYTNIARKSTLEMQKYLIDYQSGKMVSTAPFSRYCDSITNDIIKRGKIEVKQLEDKQRLQSINYKLHVERNKLWWYLVSLIIFVALAGAGVYFYIRSRYARLAEVEARTETLTRLMEEAKTSTAEIPQASDSAFFKKILMKQLGIIKLMASVPTNQNQAMLKRIAAISEGKIPVNDLLSWAEIYPIIDSLYDNFYTYLMEKFGSTLTDKEINICCLLCADFSTKEIGVITQQTDATIYVRKTSIRKKIGADEKQNIIDFINDLRRI